MSKMRKQVEYIQTIGNCKDILDWRDESLAEVSKLEKLVEECKRAVLAYRSDPNRRMPIMRVICMEKALADLGVLAE